MNHRSHLTQRLQNYFDIEDARVRQLPYSLDAQILNAAAQSMEVHSLRYEREISGRMLASCPLSIDNRGVYYRVQLPNDFPLAADADNLPIAPKSVVGYRDNVIHELRAYDDLCFQPGSADYDSTRTPVRMTSPLLGTINTALVGSLSPGVLPIPNRISFWTQDWGAGSTVLRVIITGVTWPRNLWPGTDSRISESFVVTQEGLSRSQNVWYSISSIHVYGLPEGAQMQVYAIEMNLPSVPDQTRPYMTWDDRETQLDRYWRVTPSALVESYYENSARSFPDLPVIRMVSCQVPISDLAIEPFTFGALALQSPAGSLPVLLYFDRREPLPEKLAVSALTAEPNYGLSVALADDGSLIPTVVLTTQAYANAGSESSHRYSVTDPDGIQTIYFKSPTLGWVQRPFDTYFWSPGAPASGIEFPLTKFGTYVFRLETRSGSGTVLSDATPFLNQALDNSIAFELNIPDARGIGYDYAQRLWIWDGYFLQPFTLQFDGYLFDPLTRSLYLTGQFDSVEVTS
jgi:hypothetical protein